MPLFFLLAFLERVFSIHWDEFTVTHLKMSADEAKPYRYLEVPARMWFAVESHETSTRVTESTKTT